MEFYLDFIGRFRRAFVNYVSYSIGLYNKEKVHLLIHMYTNICRAQADTEFEYKYIYKHINYIF